MKKPIEKVYLVVLKDPQGNEAIMIGHDKSGKILFGATQHKEFATALASVLKAGGKKFKVLEFTGRKDITALFNNKIITNEIHKL